MFRRIEAGSRDPEIKDQKGKDIRFFRCKNTDNRGGHFHPDVPLRDSIEGCERGKPAHNWQIGIEYLNFSGGNWRICLPRKNSLRPLRLKITFKPQEGVEEELYPSCVFNNIPNRFITLAPGTSYRLILNISRWRTLAKPKVEVLGFEEFERIGPLREGVFIFEGEYPHAMHPTYIEPLVIRGYLREFSIQD